MTDAVSPNVPLPAPPAPPTIKSTPPDVFQPPSTRPLTWPEATHRITSDLSRRGLRFAISAMMFKLQLAGRLDSQSAIVLTACALGVESAILAWKERRLPIAGVTLLPFVLAGLGALAQETSLMDAAGYTAAALVPMAGYFSRTSVI